MFKGADGNDDQLSNILADPRSATLLVGQGTSTIKIWKVAAITLLPLRRHTNTDAHHCTTFLAIVCRVCTKKSCGLFVFLRQHHKILDNTVLFDKIYPPQQELLVVWMRERSYSSCLAYN